MTTFDWKLVNFHTRARVGTVVRFIFDDSARRITAGQLGLVIWDAGNDERGKHMAGRDVILADGRTVNIPCYELTAAGSHAGCFTLPTE